MGMLTSFKLNPIASLNMQTIFYIKSPGETISPKGVLFFHKWHSGIKLSPFLQREHLAFQLDHAVILRNHWFVFGGIRRQLIVVVLEGSAAAIGGKGVKLP